MYLFQRVVLLWVKLVVMKFSCHWFHCWSHFFLRCPGPWVPGWAPCAVHYFHKAANTDCRGRNCFYRGHWEFSVVVLEFDSLSHWFPEKIKICEFCH